MGAGQYKSHHAAITVYEKLREQYVEDSEWRTYKSYRSIFKNIQIHKFSFKVLTVPNDVEDVGTHLKKHVNVPKTFTDISKTVVLKRHRKIANAHRSRLRPPANTGNENNLSPDKGQSSNEEFTNSDVPKAYRRVQLYEVKVPVYGVNKEAMFKNVFPLLEPDLIVKFVPFLFGTSLHKAMSLCVHWFVSIMEYFRHISRPISDNFADTYSDWLEIIECSPSFQKLPLDTFDNTRVDILVFAKVKSHCVNKTIQAGYTFNYSPPGTDFFGANMYHNHNKPVKAIEVPASDISPSGGSQSNSRNILPFPTAMSGNEVHGLLETRERVLVPMGSSYCESRRLDWQLYGGILGHVEAHNCLASPINTHVYRHTRVPIVYFSRFRFQCLRIKSCRYVVMHRDCTRFHGDGLGMGTIPSISTLCEGDIVEIPIPIFTPFGVMDLGSVRWTDVEVLGFAKSQEEHFVDFCDLGRVHTHWMDWDTYQLTTSELISDINLFEPIMILKESKYTGIDVVISRSVYRAVKSGSTPNVSDTLGVRCIVADSDKPIICPLKRCGLQHDRLSDLQLRVGDIFVLYLTRGGLLPNDAHS